MADNFEVGIGGNVDGLKKAFNDGIKQSKFFEARVGDSVSGVQRSFALLNNTKFTFGANFKKASDQLGGSTLPQLVKGSNQAAFALTNLGRVAQDAPFGFIGIQNNLNPLLESFSRLKAETGSTGTALKALGSSLIGPAGIGIALSVVSSAILFYQQYQSKTKKVTDEATDAFNKQRIELGKSEYTKAAGDINSLTTNIRLAKEGFVDKAAVLKQYNEGIGTTIGKVNSLDEAEQKLVKHGDAYLNLMLLKANAEVAFRKAAEANYELAEQQQKLDAKKPTISKDFNINRNRNADAPKKSPLIVPLNELIGKTKEVSKGLDGVRRKIEDTNIKSAVFALDSAKLNELKVNSDKAVQVVTSAQQKVIDFAKKNGFNLNGVFGIGGDSGSNKLDRVAKVDYAEGIGLGTLEKRISKNMEKLNTSGNVTAFEIPVTVNPATMASAGEVFKEYFDYDLLPQLGTSFDNFFNDILEKGEFSFKSLGQSIKKTFASVLASEATSGLLKVLGAKGKSMDGKGGLFPALAGLLGKGGGAAGTATAGSGAAGAGGILAGFSPAALAVGGAVIAGSLISSIVKGINKNKHLPNLYGPDGSSFIGESRTRGNDLLHTWYRTQKRKGR